MANHRPGFLALVVVAACGGGDNPQTDSMPGGDDDAPVADAPNPGSCGADGNGTVDGTVGGETVSPVVRARQFIVPGEGVAIVLDEIGACGSVGSTGEHLVLLFCAAPAEGTHSVVREQAFSCPGADTFSLIENNGGTDFAEATGGTIMITRADAQCTTGSFSITPAQQWRRIAANRHVRRRDLSVSNGAIADHDRDALERLCRYGAHRRSRSTGWRGRPTAASRTS